MATETTNETDEFADAFAALQEPVGLAAASSDTDQNADDTGATEVPAVAGDDAAVPATEVPAVPVSEVSDPVATPAADGADARIAALEAQIAALKTSAATPEVEPIAAPAAPVYTTDEQATLSKYQTDWPDIAAGEALMRRAEYQQLVGYIFNQVRQQLDPALEFYQKQQGRTQYQDIVEKVSDYDDVRDKTLAWVETQPAYLKKAYQEVANSGSAADVADLITRFKKETGYVQAPATAPAAKPIPAASAPVAAALPAAAAAAVSSLRVVKSSRSEPAQGADPNDFDAAFEEFATKTR